MPRLIKPLAALLAACMVAASARAAGVSCEAWNTGEFFERAAAADVSRCLKAGAKVNARDELGRTPLHWAAMFSATPAVVKTLLKAGARNLSDKYGRTSLHLAARFSKNVEVVKTLLLAAGAEPAARDSAGKTPWHYAEENAALKGTDVYWRLNDGRFR